LFDCDGTIVRRAAESRASTNKVRRNVAPAGTDADFSLFAFAVLESRDVIGAGSAGVRPLPAGPAVPPTQEPPGAAPLAGSRILADGTRPAEMAEFPCFCASRATGPAAFTERTGQ
jgi:hypothetical protein